MNQLVNIVAPTLIEKERVYKMTLNHFIAELDAKYVQPEEVN